jgi:[protein-PII] uridylyltransferase
MTDTSNPAAIFSSVVANAAVYEDNRDALLRAAKEYYQTRFDEVRSMAGQADNGRHVVDCLTTLCDQLIAGLFAAVSFDLTAEKVASCALIALGGYGRAEMNPRSDIDLMFYYDQAEQETAKTISDRMLYLLWDMSFDVGYSVRTARDCIDESRDTTVRTALLDARFLVGSEELFEGFKRQVTSHVLNYDTQKFINAKLNEREERRNKYGGSVYLLEPNLKEGEGGLRELHDALWIARVKFKSADLRELLMKGVISEEELQLYSNAQAYLWKIRNFLHFNGQRKGDQLTFELQQQIAEHLGYENTSAASAVEQFMQVYYARVIEYEHLASKIISRATRNQNQGMFSFWGRRNLDHGFYVIRGELRIKDDEIIRNQPELMMVAFELAQKQEVQLCPELEQLIRNNLQLINDKVRRSRVVIESFMAILRNAKGVGQTLRKMHYLKFLSAFIPEFRRIYCKVQFDLYHIYTVDIHSLFAVEEIEKIWAGEYAEAHPLLTEVAGNIEKPELLLLAVLFHDIGKGSGKDHSQRGAEMVPTIARRLRLNREDSKRLQFLVLHHLEMANISQRRDLQDMRMIAQFAEEMGMSENLKMLYLLTFADIRSVGPDVWTDWKGGLLRDLYEKAYDVLEKQGFYQEMRSEKVRNRKRKVRTALLSEYPKHRDRVMRAVNSLNDHYLMSYRSAQIIPHLRLALDRFDDTLNLSVEHNPVAGFSELTLVTVDFPGLFSYIAGVLAANSINILGAQIHTRKTGAVLDILQVTNLVGEIVDNPRKWKRVEGDLRKVIEGRVRIEDLVAKCQRPSFLASAKKRPRFANAVEFDNEVSAKYTVIDVYATDKVGLLFDITRTFNELGLYIAVSKIATKVDQVADVFYVQDIFGQKITDLSRIDQIRQTLLDRLD